MNKLSRAVVHEISRHWLTSSLLLQCLKFYLHFKLTLFLLHTITTLYTELPLRAYFSVDCASLLVLCRLPYNLPKEENGFSGSQFSKEFPACYGIRKLVTLLKASRHLSVPWARRIQSSSSSSVSPSIQHICFIAIWYFSPLYVSALKAVYFLQDSSTKPCIPVCIFVSFLSCHMPPLQFILLNILTHLCCTGKESYNVLILQ